MEVGDQERDIVALFPGPSAPSHRDSFSPSPYLNRLPPQNKKVLGALRQEPRELVHKDILDLVGLLDLDRHADGVDGGFDEHTLILIPGHCQWVQKHLWRLAGFDLRYVVAFYCLRRKVAERHCRGQGGSHAFEVRT
jgi:hypothetical protein